jgi:predicted lipoprotein
LGCDHPPGGRNATARRHTLFRTILAALCIGSVGMMLGACKIVSTAKTARAARDKAGVFVNDESFDPDKMVEGMWDTRVIPYLKAKAGPFPELRGLAARSPDEAGRKYGYREDAGNAPWTVVARIEGRIVSADTSSRAATVSVDTDGDGKADVIVQIGPALRGTALRDCLDFVSFGNFKNQIDYAQFGKAMNQHVARTALAALSRSDLVGRRLAALGAFPLANGGDPPLVAPAEISLGLPE